MRVLYGAGLNSRLVMEKIGKVDIIVDRNPNGKIIEGIKVKKPELIRDLDSCDEIFITSLKYQESILQDIKTIGTKASIYTWKDHALKNLKDICRLEDKYHSADEKTIRNWVNSALDSEVVYWDRQLAKFENDPRLKEREFYYAEDVVVKKSDILLDVGCGPLPQFGNVISGELLKYIPVDPLAFQYKKSREKYGYKLPVEPRFAIMENLTDTFGRNSADYIIVHNSMDHSIDVMRSFCELMNVLKIGGKILFLHYEAECLWEYWKGLHQWGFTVEDDNLIVIGANEQKVNISHLFRKYANIEVETSGMLNSGQRIIRARIEKVEELNSEIIEKYDSNVFRATLIEELFAKLV